MRYLTLMTPNASRRKHDLRVLHTNSRVRAHAPTLTILEGSPQSGHRAGDAGYQRGTGSTVLAAVDTLGGLLAPGVTPADAPTRAQVGELTVEGARGQTRFRAAAATPGGRARFRLASRFRRLVRDFERLPETVAGLHLVVLACLMLHRRLTLAAQWP